MPRLLTILILLCLLSTCKKDMPEADCPCTEDESLQNLYDWLYFEEGTYWIYEEENSGALDTVTVYESWRGLSQEVNESFLWFSYSSYFDYDFRYRFNDSFSNTCPPDDVCFCRRVERSKTRPGDFVGAEKIFLSPMKVGFFALISTFDEGRMDITEAIDTLNLSGIEFYDVFKHELTVDPSEDNEPTVYFLDKHMGIVRKELIDQDQIWNLKEYSILQ